MSIPPIPLAPGALPVLGHIGPLLRDPGAFLTDLPAHGELVRIRLGPVTVIMVCDAEMTRQVLLDDRTYDRGGPFFDTAREVTRNGLATCTYHEHRRLRRLIQPAFHHARLPEYARVMATQITAATDAWHDGQILDVLSETENFAARILAANLFSDKLAPSEVRQITRDITTIIKGMYRRMLMAPLRRLPTPGNVRYHHALNRLRDLTGRVVAERRASGTDGGDLLSAVLAPHDAEDADRGLSDEEIHDQVATFLLAGTETTAALVAWALHLVATHPDIEKRLHTELDTVLGGDAVTYDDLPRLELTGRIIAETLRLYPQTWLLTRTVTRDTQLANHPIPAETTIAVSPYLLHRQDVFDRPGEFDPDRWLPERAATVPRNAYLPFGAGPRQCIGNQFSTVESTLALAAIAARWHLQPIPGQRVRPGLSVSVRPRGLRMRAVARTRALISGR